MSVVTDDVNFLKELTFKKKKTKFCKRPPTVKAYLQIDEDEYRIPMAFGISRGLKPKKKKHKKIDFDTSIKLRDYQTPIIDKCLSKLKTNYTYFLQVPCAYGKTIMSIYTISMIKLLTLVVIPTDYNLLKQWAQTIIEFVPKSKIYIMGLSYAKILKELKLDKKSIVKSLDDADVILSLPTAIGKLNYKDARKIGYVICDEARLSCTEKIIKSMLNITPKYMLGLSADYERENDGMHILLDKMYGLDKYKIISNTPFTVYKINTPYKPNIEDMSDWTAVVKDISLNEERNKMICKMILDDLQPEDKILVLCKRTFHVEIIEKMLGSLMNMDTLYKDKKGYKNCKILCGTIRKMGVGFDGKNSCIENYDGIPFNKGYILSSIKNIEQPEGRIKRAKDPILYDFVDDYVTAREHWNKREKDYVKRNGTIIEKWIKMKL